MSGGVRSGVLRQVLIGDASLAEKIEGMKVKGRSEWTALVNVLAEKVVKDSSMAFFTPDLLSYTFFECILAVVNETIPGAGVECSESLHRQYCKACKEKAEPHRTSRSTATVPLTTSCAEPTTPHRRSHSKTRTTLATPSSAVSVPREMCLFSSFPTKTLSNIRAILHVCILGFFSPLYFSFWHCSRNYVVADPTRTDAVLVLTALGHLFAVYKAIFSFNIHGVT